MHGQSPDTSTQGHLLHEATSLQTCHLPLQQTSVRVTAQIKILFQITALCCCERPSQKNILRMHGKKLLYDDKVALLPQLGLVKDASSACKP